MKAVAIMICLIMFSSFSSLASAQNLPPNSSLTVKVLTPYSYKAENGTTVVLGEVINNNNFPITNVKIAVTFLDQNDNTVEFKTAKTLLNIVSAGGKAPFLVSSTSADPAITQVKVDLAGFTSSSTEPLVLSIMPNPLQISSQLSLSGSIKNDGTASATGTRIYLISYDVFQRVVSIENTEITSINPGSSSTFNMTSTPNPHAKSYKLVAESDNYQSPLTDVSSISAILPVIISDTTVTDLQGNKYATIPIGAPVKIASQLDLLVSSSNQTYIYYIQVKRFGGEVEFIGSSQGIFNGSNENPSTTWIPQTEGEYFIEVYVWGPDSVPLAYTGNHINVVLVKSQS